MYEAWPFFSSAIANMEMVLAKGDMAIAGRYAGLVQDRTVATHVFGQIRAEWDCTIETLLAVTGQSALLEKTRTWLRRFAFACLTSTHSTTFRSN